MYESDLEKAKQEFKASIAIDIDNPDSKFTSEQVESISSKMDIIFDRVNELSEQYEISESELKKLKIELESLKSSAKTYKKGMRANITENKMTQFVFEFLKSKEGRGLLIEAIKKISS